ncbi:MAG: cysteine desulfurase NifS [Christensenellaceae bacterium]|jgi:cysteine desulfurase|nr:cysteine desulfurase NifS [Christensenellaceae bacterium]
MNRIYLDNAATTRVRPEVLEAILPTLQNDFGNPSSVYSTGREAKRRLEEAREKVAKALGAAKEEIYFTSGGSEADNWAIKGVAHRAGKGHIITSAIEHHAVLHTCETLAKEGFEVSYLPVDEFGLISLEGLEKALRPDTILVSIMTANNEIGTIEPIAEIGALCKSRGIPFHTDAVQAIGHMAIDVKAQNIDLLSLSGHKIGAPKGIGALYVRKGLRLANLIDGGGQERSRRAGTENMPGIVALGTAIELAAKEMGESVGKESELRDYLIQSLLEKIPDVRLNGHPTLRLPGNVNVCIRFIEGESLLLLLDLAGIAASSGSACTSGSLDPSHVLLAIGLPHEIAHGSLRLTLSKENTREEIDATVEELIKIVERLRQMSPLFSQEKGGAQLV